MKHKHLYIFAIAVLAFWSCDDSDEFQGNERTITVAEFNAVDIDGNTVVRFDPNLSGNQTVVIRGRSGIVRDASVEVVNGTLVIRSSDNTELSDSLTVIANPSILTSITLEADQKAVVYWDGDQDHHFDNINIKTEANSRLGLFNVRATGINIQQEAQSKVQLESWFWQEVDTLAVLENDVALIGEGTYQVDDDHIMEVDSVREVTVGNQAYIVFVGPKIKRFYITPSVTATLQATSQLDADGLPVRNFDIKLEGESTASVWVLNRLSGKGEGKSTLHYRGSPEIAYTTQGEASIAQD